MGLMKDIKAAAAEDIKTPRSTWPHPLDLASLVASLLLLAAFSWHEIIALDIWWQLKTGELVLTEGWPRIDPFSYGQPGQTWIELRWLFCVAAHLIQRSMGFEALVIAKTLVLLATAFTIARLRRTRPLWPAALGISIFAICAHPRFMVRPEILTFLFLAVFLRRLDADGRLRSRRALVMLSAIQVLWVNSHTTFILGPAVLWIFLASGLVDGCIQKGWKRAWSDHGRLAGAALATSLGCLLNPYLVSGAVFPFRLFLQIQQGHPLGSVIQEFVSPLHFPLGSAINLALALAVVTGALGLALSTRRDKVAWTALWLAFFALALMAQRNVALFGLVSALIAVRGISARAASLRPRATLAGGVIPLAAALVFLPLLVTDAYPIRLGRHERFGPGLSDHRFPIRAMDFVRTQGLPRPVFGKLGDGGYFLYEGGASSTYVDGRLEIYDPATIHRYRRLQVGDGWDLETSRLGVRTAVLRHTDMQVTVDFLDRHPDWNAVYFDALHVVYLRSEGGEDPFADLRVDWATSPPAVQPALDQPIANRDLGTLFLARSQLSRAVHYLERAHVAAPRLQRIALILAFLYRATDEPRRAAELLADIPTSLAESPSMLGLLAKVLEAGEKPAEAFEASLAALDAGGKDTDSAIRLAVALGREADALPALEAAVQRGVESSRLRNNLAALHLQRGELAAARRHLEASLALDSTQVPILNQLGILAARERRYPEARAYFQAALELDPDDPNAAGNLLRLLESHR